MLKLAPSILSADFTVLGEQIKAIETAGAHYIHIDVMDGHFVPNISFGVPLVKSIRRATDMVFDVHLMITEPESFIGAFADAGADIINVHAEACGNLRNVLNHIKSLGKKPAVTIKPETPVESVFDYLDAAEMVLLMSVEPGFGGQRFIPGILQKAEKLAGYISANGLTTDIEIDGGINLHNVADAIGAGVNVVVAGVSVFEEPDIAAAVRSFYDIFDRFGKR